MADIEPESAQGDSPGRPAADQALTDRLNRLFDLRCARDGRTYTLMDFARLIQEETGVKVSHTWIARLRHGDITNPGLQSLQVLARFFGVSPTYFFDEQAPKRAAAQLELLAAMEDTGVRTVAALSYGLSPETLDAVAVMLRNARKAEGLDDAATDPKPASPPDVEG